MSTKKKIIVIITILILVFLFAYFKVLAPVKQENKKEDTKSETVQAFYTCSGNEKVSVLYDNTDKSHPLALFSSQKIAKRIMPQVISGSGARYSDGVYVWWSKGDTGFLMEATGKESVVIADCVVVR